MSSVAWPIPEALYERLIVNSTLQSSLATYAGVPAVFTSQTIPPDAEYPYIWSPPEVSNIPFDTKTTLSREISRDINIYDLDRGSMSTLYEIAKAIKEDLHRNPLDVDAGGFIATVLGPISAPTGEGIIGLSLNLRLIYDED